MKLIKALFFLAFTYLFLAPIGALIQTFTYTKLWQWFAAAQYGAGPTKGTWYGLSLIVSIVMALTLIGSRVTTEEGKQDYAVATVKSIASWVGLMIVLGGAYVIGSLLGWIA